jgi:hypothetical protein
MSTTTDPMLLPPGFIDGLKIEKQARDAAKAAAAPQAAPTGNVEERLKLARERKATRDAKLEDEKRLAELERLELEEKWEAETGGLHGRAFTIVDVSNLGEGFIVLRLGEDVLWQTFIKSKMTIMDQDAFVTACLLSPTKEAYRLIVKRRVLVADQCCQALARLYGHKQKEDEGK